MEEYFANTPSGDFSWTLDYNGVTFYFADGFLPYHVKTAWGGHYLYLFCEENEGDVPMFTLKVFHVAGGSVTSAGEMRAGPGYIGAGTYRVPTDPARLYLDDFDSMTQDMMPFAIGSTGMPEPA